MFRLNRRKKSDPPDILKQAFNVADKEIQEQSADKIPDGDIYMGRSEHAPIPPSHKDRIPNLRRAVGQDQTAWGHTFFKASDSTVPGDGEHTTKQQPAPHPNLRVHVEEAFGNSVTSQAQVQWDQDSEFSNRHLNRLNTFPHRRTTSSPGPGKSTTESLLGTLGVLMSLPAANFQQIRWPIRVEDRDQWTPSIVQDAAAPDRLVIAVIGMSGCGKSSFVARIANTETSKAGNYT
jgi:hypothetical protein